MKLNSPVTVNMHGTDIVLEDLDLAIMDMPKHKVVLVKIHPAAKPVLLWKDQTYDDAGDYTQAQVESRVLELLGDDLQRGLQDLFALQVL